jgi:hypothetical protein
VPLTAQAPRLLAHADEQQADSCIHPHIARALEHAVAVIVGYTSSVGVITLANPGVPAFERAVRVAFRIRRRQEKEGQLSMNSLSDR